MNSYVKMLSSILLVLYYWLESIVLTFVPKRLRYKDVSGETVLITGGGSGIGRLLALRFANLGSRVVLWDINVEGAQETAKTIREMGGNAEAHAYRCDISKPEEVYRVAAKVKDEIGKISILINNAGIVSGKRFLDIPDEMILKTFHVNAIAHFWMCKAFLPDMIADNHGHIVSIASLAGVSGVVRLTDYCASKFAAVGFEEALRMELHAEGHTGVKSTVVCPYFINTGMFEGAKPGIFTMMTPEYVADEIVSAVLVNQEVLLLPKVFNLLVAFKGVLPPNALKEALGMFDISSSMFQFCGRKDSGPLNTVPKEGKCCDSNGIIPNGIKENGHVHGKPKLR